MDESQSIILLEFDCNWSNSYGLRLKTSIVDPDLHLLYNYTCLNETLPCLQIYFESIDKKRINGMWVSISNDLTYEINIFISKACENSTILSSAFSLLTYCHFRQSCYVAFIAWYSRTFQVPIIASLLVSPKEKICIKRK